MKKFCSIAFATAFLTLNVLSFFPIKSHAEDEAIFRQAPYKKKQISDARFGDEDRQKLLNKAYQLRDSINTGIAGQDRVARAIQDRVIQYLENLGSRTNDPIALHLIGLPGIGKSAILVELEKLGITFLKVDAQTFTGFNSGNAINNFTNMLSHLAHYNQSGTPTILVVEEIDKVPEIVHSGERVDEQTSPLIGLLNEILTSGKYNNGNSKPLNLSNTLILTSMNFSPQEIEKFTETALGHKTNFWDFSIEDFQKFDDWIRKDPAAKSKVLSRLFRSNTVSRLVPNTMIVKPLDANDYRQIIKSNIDQTIKAATEGKNTGKRLNVIYDETLIDFLFKHAVYAPSGARDTVIKVNFLVEQLINFGTKAEGQSADSLAQPRIIQLTSGSDEKSVAINVITRIGQSKKTHIGEKFEIVARYDDDSRSFLQPPRLALAPPALLDSKPLKEKSITKKEILETRFPKNSNALKGLAEKIDEKLFGQHDLTKFVEKELGQYLARAGEAKKNPSFSIIAGFPGIGKTELVNLAGEFSELPVARINMQAYSSDGQDTLQNFMLDLSRKVSEARNMSVGRKYILLIEELDKVFEINPKTGDFVDRPIMNFIKDLLNDGKVSYQLANNTLNVNINDAYSFITMNFGVSRFGFQADPRLTSIQDVTKAWESLNSRLTDLKGVLDSLFLPETVSRMLPRTKIMKPLQMEDYRKVIAAQIQHVVSDRFIDRFTKKNKALVTLEITERYKAYLESETIIPSEGARNTVIASHQKISIDLEAAMRGIQRTSAFGTKPMVITLDFDPETSEVSAEARVVTKTGEELRRQLMKLPVTLKFPPLEARGRMTEKRLLTAVHEFGHAFEAIRLGLRIEYATVVPPRASVGGYVKYRGDMFSADAMITRIYTALASRAMERIFLSADALLDTSVLDITSGASSDISSATALIWKSMHMLGFNPKGGVMDRSGINFAPFETLPAEDTEKLGKLLRAMEDYLVKDFLVAHTREWYVEKIEKFARSGGMNERELYALISYTFPGEDNENLAANTRLREAFKDSVIPLSDELLGVMNTPQSDTKSTPRENLLKARANLVEGISRLELGDPVPDGLTHAASKHGKAGCETYFEGAHAAQDIAQNAAK